MLVVYLPEKNPGTLLSVLLFVICLLNNFDSTKSLICVSMVNQSFATDGKDSRHLLLEKPDHFLLDRSSLESFWYFITLYQHIS